MRVAELEECYGSKQTTCYVNDNVELGQVIWFKGMKWIVIKIK